MESESELRWFEIEMTSKKTAWRTHQYFIDFESRIDIQLSTSNRCHSFHVHSHFLIDEISMNFWCRNSISNRCQIDKNVSIGSKTSQYQILQISFSYNCYMQFFLWYLLLLVNIFCPKNSTIHSRKTSITQDWLIVESCPTSRWIVFLLLFRLVYNICSHFNELNLA